MDDGDWGAQACDTDDRTAADEPGNLRCTHLICTRAHASDIQ
jgi:hypothetical protein